MRASLALALLLTGVLLSACSDGGSGDAEADSDADADADVDGDTDAGSDGGPADGEVDGRGPDGSADAYAGLMGVAAGEVRCNGDSCCFRRCWGNEDTICATRDMQTIIASIEGFDGDASCDLVVFPEWFYNQDCFIGTDGVVGPGHPSAAGTQITYPNAYNAEAGGYHLFAQCFCGRGDGTFASEFSADLILWDEGCGVPLRANDDDESIAALARCDNPCVTCEASCDGRVCGSDGCGGSCGTCPDGSSCSATGQCLSSPSGDDSCSGCLSTCRGLASCCTGCGCICEDACGGCF